MEFFRVTIFGINLGGNRNARDAFNENEHFGYCEEFCSEYDSPAFDPSYKSNPLEHYEPLIRDFFIRNPWSDNA